MNILIKQAKIVDPGSSFNGRSLDIFVSNGIIKSIGKNINEKASCIIDQKHIHISPGWVDMFADFTDPGFEYRGTLETESKAAAAGGFTDICVIPNTKPVIDQKSMIEYIISASKELLVTIWPIGAVTKKTDGRELAEIYDMKFSGAIAFSDGSNALQSSDIMIKALQYVKSFNGLIIQLPDNKDIQPHGLINEGLTAIRLGLQSKPAIAEELMVARDIKLASYTQSRIHLTGISTEGAVKIIKEAKQKQSHITTSVSPFHLFFTEEDLTNYDTNLKVNPPLRTIKDRKSLQKAVIDGIIDCIASHHTPHERDSKIVEFEYAKNGMIGLQTAYAVINSLLPDIPQDRWIEMLSLNPRKILGLPTIKIEEGAVASLTLFNPFHSWTFEEKDILSSSKNSAFIGKTFTGRPLGIIHNNKTNLQL